MLLFCRSGLGLIRIIAMMLLSAMALSLSAESDPGPNVVFILADDLGWSDLGCYGHPWHQTPHLDRLSSDGIRFTHAYAAAPICSASRASILTGKSPARLNFEFVTKNEAGRQTRLPGQSLVTPPFTLDLPLTETTIAECLAESGYRTAFFGKWHLNAHHQGYLGWSPTHGPPRQGFQTAVEGFGSHPYAYRGQRDPPQRVTESGKFPRDDVTMHAIDFLSSPGDQPLFLMVSHFYVHTPVETRCEWLISKYQSIIPEDVPNREKRVRYAAFVETLDHYVGQLLQGLESSGKGDQTLVIFTSDNGGHPEYAANAPLRGSKWNLYEGGIRVPMLIRWPGIAPAGVVADAPVIGYDLLPTLAEVAGSRRLDVGELDGVSLATILRDPQASLDRDIFWHFPYYHPERGYAESLDQIGINDFALSKTRPQSAFRRGSYKLLRFAEDERVELYDLSRDPGERNNLLGRRPQRAAELDGALRGYLEQVGARMAVPPVAR